MSIARTAVVTGGTRGIGKAISLALVDAGYKVAATYVQNETAAHEFSATSGIPTYKFDVTDFDACQRAVAQIADELGAIEILVNNAGITRDGTLHKMTVEQWQTVLDTNLTSCFNMCRAAIESMRLRGFGRIVNISSINGQAGQFGQANYAAAKAGTQGFTRALALEGAGKGVTVNAVAPGYIDTEMVRALPATIVDEIVAKIPVGRLGRPEDIARAVLFLVADDAAFITGTTLSINGGQYLQ